MWLCACNRNKEYMEDILGQVMMDIGWLVQEDREHYQTLKYIFISPSSYYVYLVGRSATRFLLSLFPVILLLVLGIFLKIPYRFNYLLLVFAVLLGITTAYFITLSLALYFSMDYLARRKGALEMITTY